MSKLGMPGSQGWELLDDSPPVRIYIDTDGANLLLKCVKLNRWANRATHDGATGEDVERLRQLPQGRWSDVEGAWVAPCTDPNVRHVLDSWQPAELTYSGAARMLLEYHLKTRQLADIKLAERLAFMRGETTREPEAYIFAAHKPPLAHQKVAFSSGRYAEYFAYLMEMGTGKTKTLIDVMCDRARRAQELFKSGQTTQRAFWALIVAPKTVCGEWSRQVSEWTTLPTNLEILRGSKLSRVEALTRLIADRCEAHATPSLDAVTATNCDKCGATPLRIAVINYEGLEVMGDALEAIPWDFMVCDESIWIKNASAKRSKAAHRLADHAKARAILTGLPITRNIDDLYSQFHFLKPGLLGFTSFYAFKDHYSPDGYNQKYWRENVLPELQKNLAQFSFIIKRAQCFDLPPKTYSVRDIEMGDDQARAYDQMLTDFVVGLETGKFNHDDAPEFDKENLSNAQALMEYAASDPDKFAVAQIVLVQMLRLSQITSGFMKLASGKIHRFSPNPKVEAVKEILDEIDPLEKVIIWTRFREDIEHLELELSDYRPLKLYGGLSDAARDRAVTAFQNDPRYRVIIGQPKSGGFGLNLTAANHVIYMSNEWGLGERGQSEDRCHRLGQTKNVLYDDLVVPKTIDEVMLARIKAKKELSELLTDRRALLDIFKAQLDARKHGE